MSDRKKFSIVRKRNKNYNAFAECIKGYDEHPEILSMDKYIQHSDVTTLRHCIHVSFLTFVICRKLKFKTREATRAALVHDMFLYDWHDNPKFTFHGFTHPTIALKNAEKAFGGLTNVESDVILNHMWPLTIYRMPKHKETFVVVVADKVCTILEVMKIRSFTGVDKKVYNNIKTK